MTNLIARARRWWKRDGLRAPPVPYEVACACGEVARGLRQARHQVVRCGACGGPVFVLPRSPLLTPVEESAPAPRGGPVRPRRVPAWGWPLVGAAVTLAAVVVVYAVLLGSLVGRPKPAGPPPGPDASRPLRAGEAALAAGKFQQATYELAQARRLLGPAPAAESRRVAQLHRQAALLADLLSEPLEELLLVARRTPEDEWRAQFERRYEGQAVVFDADVTREGSHRYRLHYAFCAGPEKALIEVSDLHLLDALPADRPPRLLFGARLATLRREAGGAWVVRFAPESGVLLTDVGAVTACCPPPIDEGLREVLRRQAVWADAFP
jgi:hypothetical protein